jgi:hypothetical protein
MRWSSLPVARHSPPAGLFLRAGLTVVVLAVIALSSPVPGLAAPLLQDQKPVIAQPQQDAVVKGVVQVIGTATHPDFQRYELYYTPWPVASDNAWIFIGPDAHFQQQPLGLLGTWDSRAVPDGAYGLRLRVVRKDGNYYDSEARRVTVANVNTPDTPTPAVSPTVTITITVIPGGKPTQEPTLEPTLEPTATIMVQLPGQKTPAPEATLTVTVKAGGGTPTPAVTPILSSGSSGSSGGTGLGDIAQSLSLDRVGSTAKRAAVYTLGAFAVLGLFFGVKALLVWTWHRMRP